MGLDGIAITQVGASQGIASDDPLSGDVILAGIEFGRILADMKKASDALGTGQMRETMIALDRVTLIFQAVDDDLVVVLALHPDGNLGKARYLIRRSLVDLRAEL